MKLEIHYSSFSKDDKAKWKSINFSIERTSEPYQKKSGYPRSDRARQSSMAKVRFIHKSLTLTRVECHSFVGYGLWI